MWLNIDILNIHKTFSTQTILPDVSLRIAGGSIMVILGSSGSGKTSFCSALMLWNGPNAPASFSRFDH